MLANIANSKYSTAGLGLGVKGAWKAKYSQQKVDG